MTLQVHYPDFTAVGTLKTILPIPSIPLMDFPLVAEFDVHRLFSDSVILLQAQDN